MGDLDNPEAYWEKRRKKDEETRNAGGVDIRIAGRRYQVVCPSHEGFKTGMGKMYGARWRHRSGMWSVPVFYRSSLRRLITECFGADQVPVWMRTDRPKKGATDGSL